MDTENYRDGIGDSGDSGYGYAPEAHVNYSEAIDNGKRPCLWHTPCLIQLHFKFTPSISSTCHTFE